MTREPDMMMTMAYGAPSISITEPQIPQIQIRPMPSFSPSTKMMKVTCMREEDGTLKLKVYSDGVLLFEMASPNGTTITTEFSV